jgi:hypothetical protein
MTSKHDAYRVEKSSVLHKLCEIENALPRSCLVWASSNEQTTDVSKYKVEIESVYLVGMGNSILYRLVKFLVLQ